MNADLLIRIISFKKSVYDGATTLVWLNLSQTALGNSFSFIFLFLANKRQLCSQYNGKGNKKSELRIYSAEVMDHDEQWVLLPSQYSKS